MIAGNPKSGCTFDGLADGAHERGIRTFEAYAGHRSPKLLSILGLVYRLAARPDEFDFVGVQHSLTYQVERAVEPGLAAHRRQQRVRTLLRDDSGDHLPVHRLDVRGIGKPGIGHDGGRIGVHQHHPEAFFGERLARLHSGVVELAGLADDDRPGPDDQYRLDVLASRHRIGLPSEERRPVGAIRARLGARSSVGSTNTCSSSAFASRVLPVPARLHPDFVAIRPISCPEKILNRMQVTTRRTPPSSRRTGRTDVRDRAVRGLPPGGPGSPGPAHRLDADPESCRRTAIGG